MLTGISGSNTVEIACDDGRLQRLGLTGIGVEGSGGVGSGVGIGSGAIMGRGFIVSSFELLGRGDLLAIERRLQRVPGQAGALHADGKLAHPGKHRQLAELLDRLIRRRR